MRLDQTYRTPSSRSGNALLWLLVIIAAAGLFWLWSAATKTKPRKVVAPPAASAVSTSAPPARVKATAPLVAAVAGFPRPVQTPFEAQLALDRLGISSGSLDGKIGSQTRAALRAFQRQSSLPETGELDDATKTNLTLDVPPLTTYTITSNDLARLQPVSKTWLGKSQQTALDYETVLELVAEKSHSHPELIRRLNPGVNWTGMATGIPVQVPDVNVDDPPGKAAFARISLSEKILEAFDSDSNLLVHFPCSIAQRVEKRPVGELHVAAIAPNPNYTFDPELFPESPEAKEQPGVKLILPPGPNNPVGTVWISLDKTGYGIHGTPRPEDVGRTESHGCFRLANWNAELLLKIVWMGMPVYVEP
ncbi:MAG TPA: L,D-transpeptidase family protein [Verrucomicrobiae bacterium]|nr:L,D-transpeptidase family protein [Verrucomicrobiae bacterium]